MENKYVFKINVGLPSVVLIFVVLCLVSFGVLSFVSADMDRRLGQKMLDRTAAYYNACNSAEEMLCEIDKKLRDAYVRSHDGEEYARLVSIIPCSYTYEINDTQYLDVTLSYPYPENAPDGSLYRIMSWRVTTK